MKTALIVVDIQNDYFPNGKMELVGTDVAARNAGRLLASFRESKRPIFHIQHINGPNALFFAHGTSGSEIHESVRPQENEPVIQKSSPNSFHKTSLLGDLQDEGIEQAIICGAMSHMCIDATTRAASDFGFDCIVAHDACAAKDLEFEGNSIAADKVHGSFMAALSFAYAKVVSTDEAISTISKVQTSEP